jgi:BASS family bile acid:Na+ symporter
MRRLAALSHFIHEYFIWFLLGSYALAAVWPGLGLAIRKSSFGEITVFGEKTALTLPVVMLALLLLNAGLGVPIGELKNLLRHPLALFCGLAANLVVPIAYIFVVAQTMRLWHNPEEVQHILVGLALVASMPIAGSSTAWSQNASGNLALSLGLVLCSTLLSPLTTPVALHSVGLMTTGDYAEDLHELASGGAGGFLAVSVFVPSLLGIAAHVTAGEARVRAAKPALRLLNSLNLLLLNYSNAAVSLPQTIADPDWDFLAVVLTVVVTLCALSFGAGWLIGRWLKAGPPEQVSLMFGLGMNNNGTGLVLASMALADHPRVLLPIIFYNLVQHLVAGCVDWALGRTNAGLD